MTVALGNLLIHLALGVTTYIVCIIVVHTTKFMFMCKL